MADVGRDTKLTPELQTKVIDYIKNGNYTKTACQAVGISEQTYYTWVKRGKDGESPFVEFLESVERARAEAEVRNVFIVQVAAKKDWRAAMTWLERVNYKDWGRKELIGGIEDKPIKAEFIIRKNADD